MNMSGRGVGYWYCRVGWSVLFVVLVCIGSSVAPGTARGTPEGGRRGIRSPFPQSGGIFAGFQDINRLMYGPDTGYLQTLQKRIPISTPHPCNDKPDRPKWRSEFPPKSVHKLRPGDIDVIAAMGDSIVAGNGARETDPLGILIDDKGVSFLGGGMGTWHDFTTLPNIIKAFNPFLTGFATGRGLLTGDDGELNLAGAGTRDSDLLEQAVFFEKTLRTDPKYNIDNQWKLLSILTGHNNVCTLECYDKETHSPKAHKSHLKKALDYLYEHVPRLLVNIIPIIDPTINPRTTSGIACSIIRRIGCRCLYTVPEMDDGILQLSTLIREYQEAEKELVFSGDYDGRDDFSVEWQPFLRSLNAPEIKGAPEDPEMLKLLKSNEQIWTPDCFHFNQRGHQQVSILLWNNMLEPVGNKSERFQDFKIRQYKCPTKENPYFFTKNNTITYKRQGHQ